MPLATTPSYAAVSLGLPHSVLGEVARRKTRCVLAQPTCLAPSAGQAVSLSRSGPKRAPRHFPLVGNERQSLAASATGAGGGVRAHRKPAVSAGKP